MPSGASPGRRGGDDDDRSPSPSLPLRKSRGRMQTPSAETKSAAKSDSPPRGRTVTRSSSRAASRGGSPKAAADNVKIAAAAAAHYQPLDAEYPDRVRAPSVSRRGYCASSPDFSSSRLGRASAKRDKSVERNNDSSGNNVRRSERISSRAPRVDPSARVGKPRGRSACARWCKQW